MATGTLSFGQVLYSETLSGTSTSQLQADGWLVSGWSAGNGGLYNGGNTGAFFFTPDINFVHNDSCVGYPTVSFKYISGGDTHEKVTVKVYLTNENMSDLIFGGDTSFSVQDDSAENVTLVLNDHYVGSYQLRVEFDFSQVTSSQGKELTLLGDFVVDGCSGSNSLAVDFMGFNVNRSSQGLLLDWVTGTEQNSSYFVIERSTDGKNFREVARIPTQALNGNSRSRLYYSYLMLLTR